MGKPVAYGKQNSVHEIFIAESRLPFAQISSINRKRKKQTNKQTNKTKQGSTLNKLTEIGSESARYILLGQTDNFWSSFRLVIKFFG